MEDSNSIGRALGAVVAAGMTLGASSTPSSTADATQPTAADVVVIDGNVLDFEQVTNSLTDEEMFAQRPERRVITKYGVRPPQEPQPRKYGPPVAGPKRPILLKYGPPTRPQFEFTANEAERHELLVKRTLRTVAEELGMSEEALHPGMGLWDDLNLTDEQEMTLISKLRASVPMKSSIRVDEFDELFTLEDLINCVDEHSEGPLPK